MTPSALPSGVLSGVLSDDFKMSKRGARGRRALRRLRNDSVESALMKSADPEHLAKFRNRRSTLDVVSTGEAKIGFEMYQGGGTGEDGL